MREALVIDDDANWRAILSSEVEGVGISATAVASLSEAQSLLENNPRRYSLVVLDLFYEKEDWASGLLLLRKLRESGNQTPVIVVTQGHGVDSNLVIKLFEEYRISAYFRKNADTDPFRKAVERVRRSDDLPLDRLKRICERFHSVALELSRKRREGRPTLTIADEYDVQDLLRGLLQLDFDDVRPEEWTPSYAGNASRVDFLLKNESIVVEVKKTRKNLGQREVSDQLIIDIARYRTVPHCDLLVCFVYDPDHVINNPAGVESDLTGQSTPDLEVVPVIAPRLS